MYQQDIWLIFQVWDARQRAPVHTFQATYQVTAVSFSDTAEQIFSGGIDNEIKVYYDQHIYYVIMCIIIDGKWQRLFFLDISLLGMCVFVRSILGQKMNPNKFTKLVTCLNLVKHLFVNKVLSLY